MLDDTPKFSEYSSASSSPRGGAANAAPVKVTSREFEQLTEKVEDEYRKQQQQEQSTSKKLKSKPTQHKKKGLLVLASKVPHSNTKKNIFLMSATADRVGSCVA